MGTPVFLIANPRSGTHLLRGYLSGASRIEDFGEVFNIRHEHPGAVGFFDFLLERASADPAVTVPRSASRAKLFDDYVGHLDARAVKPFFVIDVKYNSTQHFNGVWHNVDDTPAMIDLIKARGFPVVTLVRRNLLELLCSEQLAMASGRWVRYRDDLEEGSSSPATKITVDTKTLIVNLDKLLTRIRFFNWCLGDHVPLLVLEYETLLEGGQISGRVRDGLADLLGTSIDGSRDPATAKMSPPLRDYVDNYDDVVRTLQGTPYARMVA